MQKAWICYTHSKKALPHDTIASLNEHRSPHSHHPITLPPGLAWQSPSCPPIWPLTTVVSFTPSHSCHSFTFQFLSGIGNLLPAEVHYPGPPWLQQNPCLLLRLQLPVMASWLTPVRWLTATVARRLLPFAEMSSAESTVDPSGARGVLRKSTPIFYCNVQWPYRTQGGFSGWILKGWCLSWRLSKP